MNMFICKCKYICNEWWFHKALNQRRWIQMHSTFQILLCQKVWKPSVIFLPLCSMCLFIPTNLSEIEMWDVDMNLFTRHCEVFCGWWIMLISLLFTFRHCLRRQFSSTPLSYASHCSSWAEFMHKLCLTVFSNRDNHITIPHANS